MFQEQINMKNSEFLMKIISRQIVELNAFNQRKQQKYFESDEVDQHKKNYNEIKTHYKQEKWSSQLSYSDNMISTDTPIHQKYD